MRKDCDYLIVGAGIAGLCIASYLENENQNFKIINQDLAGAATKVSSGVINPATGQRLVLSWKYEELKAEFLKFYSNLGNRFNEKFIEEMQLIQILKSADEQNLWLSRTADPNYKIYFDEPKQELSNQFNANNLNSYGIIKSMYHIKIELFLEKLKSHFQLQEQYVSSSFDFEDLIRTEKELIWRDMTIRKAIIFAEGFRIASNPFFNWLPVIPVKGECLEIEMPGERITSMYKSDYAIVPVKGNEYWVGANFDISNASLHTTEIEKQNQIDFLNSNLKNAFKVKKHTFGIRPASRDRRPILGSHPNDSRLIVFNGLGTKGLSLAPYCAFHLIQYLLKKIPIPKEISLNRFKTIN